MAELNGETPVEGRYIKHLEDVLGEDDDSDDGRSNTHESVRVAHYRLFVTITDIPSPHGVKRSPTPESLSPLALITILARSTSSPSISRVKIAIRSPQQVPNGFESPKGRTSGKISPTGAAESPSNLRVVQNLQGLTVTAILIRWFALLLQP